MKWLLSIFIISVFACCATAQLGPSPALDPDYVVLYPKQTYTGRYANSFVGRTIKTVPSLGPFAPRGGVFLNNVDTAGWKGYLEQDQPTGPFVQGPSFSLFSHALFRLKDTRFPTIVFARTESNLPLIVADVGVFGVLYPTESPSPTYTDSSRVSLISRDRDGLIGHGESPHAVHFDSNVAEDLLLVQPKQDSTRLLLWKDSDLYFRGDTFFQNHVLPATAEFTVPTAYDNFRSLSQVIDIDRDGVWDIAFLADSLNNGTPFGRWFLTVVFGKRDASGIWEVDTTINYRLKADARGIGFSDFLYSDGVPDLLFATNDTMYCFDGSAPHFLRTGFDLQRASLKIPSPAKLDPETFTNGGRLLFDWGYAFRDAGNFNGFGDHCLMVYGAAIDTLSLGGPAYAFLYSGGKAADERADALIIDNGTIYSGFGTGDTVHTSDSGPTDFLAGDVAHDAGSVGRIYLFKGDATVPHKPDSRWISSVHTQQPSSQPSLTTRVSNGGLEVFIQVVTGGQGVLQLHDLLGRIAFQTNIDCTAVGNNTVRIDATEFPSGLYFVSYRDSRTFATSECLLDR